MSLFPAFFDRVSLTFLAPALFCLGLCGCACFTSDPAGRAMIQPLEPPAEWASPRVFREAQLPQGYPPPGPVNQIVLKKYPAARLAVSRGESGGENARFMDLFRHIDDRGIAMTAPVQMSAWESQDAPLMAFVYPSRDLGETGVIGPVEVTDAPPLSVVSLGVSGSYSAANYAEPTRRLKAWLENNPLGLRPTGPPRILGYNSPFILPFLKYGEVQIPVEIPIGFTPPDL